MKRSSSLRLTLWPMPSISVTSVPIVRPLSSPRKPSAYGGSLREPGGAHRCAPLRDCYPPGTPFISSEALRLRRIASRARGCASLRSASRLLPPWDPFHLLGSPPPTADRFASQGVRIAALRFATATPLGPLSSRRGRGSLLGGRRLFRGHDRLHD